jgi:hypothetical protein
MAEGATIGDPSRGFLANPNRNCAAQPGLYNPYHYTVMVPDVWSNGEGLDGTVLDTCRALTPLHRDDEFVDV